jgi:D-alanyl-D-alanine carboxypeptidase/D-alanyl-D-alanine-endopeptidase (penicillin-binding protein 4)
LTPFVLRSIRSVRLAALVSAVATGTSGLAVAQDAQAVQANIASWWEQASKVAPGTWGIAIADEAGRLIWSVAPQEPLIPASTVKLFTTGFARSVLGSDARRATRVVGTGQLDQATGNWVGDWALELNGDVTLERGAGFGPSFHELALQMRQQGITRISGPLTVRSADGPADAIWPSAWATRHRGRLFAPLIGPLTLHENVVEFAVKPAARSGQRAVLVGASPSGVESLVRVTAVTRAGRRSRLRFVAQPNGSWVISGTIGTRAGVRRFGATAAKPEVVLKAVWASAVKRAGIDWQQRAEPTGRPAAISPRILAEVTSPTLDSVASEVNRRSLNIGAELLLQWAAGRGPQASAALVDHVRHVTGDSVGVHLVDGSGLSNDDRVAPATFVSYLARFPQTAAGRNFPQLLPANGSGTLRRLNTGLPEAGVVRAKTGTLNRVSTVVGYLGRPDGVLLVSLMYNGNRSAAARQQQWQLFRLLGANGVAIPTVADSLESDAQLGGASTEP